MFGKQTVCLLLSVYSPCDNYTSSASTQFTECIDYIESTVWISMLLFVVEILTLLLIDRMAKQNVLIASLLEIIYVFLGTIQFPENIYFTYTNLSLNQFSCIDHIITTRNVFDSIVENVLICDTLNMSNHNIVYMSIAINNFTNIINVDTCDIHVFNCAWKKATTEHKRQYELQLDNNLKQLIDFKNNNLYCTDVLCDFAEHILQNILMTYVTQLLLLVRQ